MVLLAFLNGLADRKRTLKEEIARFFIHVYKLDIETNINSFYLQKLLNSLKKYQKVDELF